MSNHLVKGVASTDRTWGACCGRDCLSSSSLSFCVAARRRVSGRAPLTSRSILRCPCYPHQGVPNAYVGAKGCHATDPSGVSSSFSSNTRNKKRQNRPGEILKGPPRCMVETVETHQRIRSRQQPPPIRSPLTQHIQRITTQRKILRVITRPFKPGLMPPLQRRHTIATNPVVAAEHLQLRRRALHQRAAMHSHFSRPHAENADAPHSDGVSHATHPTRYPAANPDAP
jgi:hypothetical protein